MSRDLSPQALALIGKEFKILDHGSLTLIDVMGQDETVIEAARMSTGRGFISWEPYRRCKNELCEEVQTLDGKVLIPNEHVNDYYCLHPNWETLPNGDMGLLDTLWRKKHATPFEMGEMLFEVVAPLFVFREWHRHRTQCLAGNTKLFFDLPGGIERRGTQKYMMTIKEVFEKFQPTRRSSRPERQTNALGSQQRIQAMRLRCVNEETKEVTHTSIVDVWESGQKAVFEVEARGFGTIRCSADHRFFTPQGWKRLKELMTLPDGTLEASMVGMVIDPKGAVIYGVDGVSNESVSFEIPAIEAEEQWSTVAGWDEFYEVSDMGRVRRIAGGQGVRSQGTCKKLSPDMAGYLCTTLNRPGEQIRPHVHRLVLEAFRGPCPEGMECRHIDGNQQNNWLSNLAWGTAKENAEDRVLQGRVPSLKTREKVITSVKFVGYEMTYDIEVADPWHNFVAEGFVVHNSYNEFSARYSVMPNLHYVPSEERLKQLISANKQASSMDAEVEADLMKMRHSITMEQQSIYDNYEDMIQAGVPKEVARVNTPVSRYSKMRAKTDLRNWLAFENLRYRPDAQWEIRQYAGAIADVIKGVFPRSWGLFEEYDLYGAHFSRTELNALRGLLASGGADVHVALTQVCKDTGLSGRKKDEFINKLQKGGKEIL